MSHPRKHKSGPSVMRTFRISADIDAMIEQLRGDTKRTVFVENALRKECLRLKRQRPSTTPT